MSIPADLLVHTATVTPWEPDGDYGDPFPLSCNAQFVGSAVLDVDGMRATGKLYADLGVEIPIGSQVEVHGITATVTTVDQFFDGGITGLEHRRIEWTTHPLLSSCVVERFDGFGELDPETNTEPETWTEVWSGPCRVQTEWADRNQVLGEQRVDFDRVKLATPWGAPELITSMRVTITGSFDPHLVGLVAVVESSDRDFHGAERRYIARVDRG